VDWLDGQPGIVALFVFLYGVASALFPVLNIEVIALGLPIAQPESWWLSVVTLTLGQTVGKVVIFQAARHGATWLDRWKTRNPGRSAESGPEVWRRVVAWSNQLFRLLDYRWPAFGVVLLSASAGLPPLAVVSIVAGVRSCPLWVFVVATTIGRGARILVLAVPVALAS
jgi:membrane protein YqaA with SNARE-associated domain